MLHLLQLSRTYLAHHELESEFIAIINFIGITVPRACATLLGGWLAYTWLAYTWLYSLQQYSDDYTFGQTYHLNPVPDSVSFSVCSLWLVSLMINRQPLSIQIVKPAGLSLRTRRST